METDMNERFKRYGSICYTATKDLVLYEDDNYYICVRDDETRYFCKYEYEHDGDKEMGLVELNQDVVPCGFLNIIGDLITQNSVLKGLLDVAEGRVTSVGSSRWHEKGS